MALSTTTKTTTATTTKTTHDSPFIIIIIMDNPMSYVPYSPEKNSGLTGGIYTRKQPYCGCETCLLSCV
jgi:hypothetical protein